MELISAIVRINDGLTLSKVYGILYYKANTNTIIGT